VTDQFDRIRGYIERYDGDDYVSIESGTPASDGQIAAIVDAMNVTLPQDYRDFLSEFGTLEIGGIEVAGAAEGHLEVVSMRDELMTQHSLPGDLIPVINEDGDSFVCIDLEGQLVRWQPGGGSFGMDESLGDYLVRLCEELIEDEAGDVE